MVRYGSCADPDTSLLQAGRAKELSLAQDAGSVVGSFDPSTLLWRNTRSSCRAAMRASRR